MAQWLHAEYRDFHDFPRAMVCTNRYGTFYFRSPFDDSMNEYCDYYEVYRLPTLAESALCSSWFGLETRALCRLTDIPVRDFPFDLTRRRFLDCAPIEPLLSRNFQTAGQDAT